MQSEDQEIQVVASLLRLLGSRKTPTMSFFYQDWMNRFSKHKVPAKQIISAPSDAADPSTNRPVIVIVDRLQAIEFLKKRYNFYSRTEMTQILEEEAQCLNSTSKK